MVVARATVYASQTESIQSTSRPLFTITTVILTLFSSSFLLLVLRFLKDIGQFLLSVLQQYTGTLKHIHPSSINSVQV